MTVEPIDVIPETFALVGSNGGYTVWESEDGVQHIVQPDGGECYLVTWGDEPWEDLEDILALYEDFMQDQ